MEHVVETAQSRAFVVMNPMAGHSTSAVMHQTLEATFGSSDWQYHVYETTGNDDIEAEVRAALADGCDLVVAAGGDGTVSEVAHALVGSDVPLGILPVGTANVLSLELGLPQDVVQAAALFTGDHTLRALDAMQVNGHSYVLQIGVGLDALMIKDTARGAKRVFGRLAYMTTLAMRMVGYQSRRCTLLIDGQRMRPRAWQLLVANAGTLGFPPFRWGPDIDPSDGELDLCIFNVRLPLDRLRIAWQLLTGRHQTSHSISYVRVRKRVIITTDDPMPVQADGEIIGNTPIQIDIVPQAIKVIVPQAVATQQLALQWHTQEAGVMASEEEFAEIGAQQSIDTTREALEQAIAKINTPEQADKVVADLNRVASTVTEKQVADRTPTPSNAQEASNVIQQATQGPSSKQPQTVIATAAAQIAAANPEDEALLVEGVQQATNPKVKALPEHSLDRQRRLLREAMLRQLKPLQAFDVSLFLSINQLPHPPLANNFMYGLTTIMNRGDGWALWLLAATLYDHHKGRRAMFDVLPALWLATATVEFPIKHVVRRRRPFISVVRAIVVGKKPGSYSFPSGHSAAAFAGASLLRRHYPEWAPVFYAIAALTGFSRTYLGAHYPGDVLTGAVSGTIIAEAYRYLLDQLVDAID